MSHSLVSEPISSGSLVMESSTLAWQAPDLAKEENKMDVNADTSHSKEPTDESQRTDVKLEDLFNDVNEYEDDEFSGLGVPSTNKSSPPGAPL